MRSISFCLLLLCSVFSDAQDTRKVSCRFLCLEGTTPPPPLLNLGDKGVEIACTIPTETFSQEVVCVTKGNVINFVSSTDRKPAATATIPEAVNAAILVFVPPAKTPNALPWRIFVIEDSAKNFPDGGAFVANFHDQDLRFVIGGSPYMLHPGGSHGFVRPEKRDAFNMAPVVFYFQQGDTWQTASESMMRFTSGKRYLFFAYVDLASGRPRIFTFQDFKNITAPPPPVR
jgi:hypothetical protein